MAAVKGEAPMPAEQEITYSADGVEMRGVLATPDAGARGPAVLLAHEAPGLSEHCRDRARRLAELGYVAFALDAWGDARVLPLDEVRPRMMAWIADPTGLHLRVKAALDVLTGQPGVDAG